MGYNIKWLWYKKVLGISDYTKIKKSEKARIGLPGKPIAELTKLDWYIVPAGKENDIRNILFSQTSIHDYQKLCSLDCLGVSEEEDKPDDYVYKKFRKQLGRGLGRTMKPISSGKRNVHFYKYLAVWEDWTIWSGISIVQRV